MLHGVGNNHLNLKVNNTKEMNVDFGRTRNKSNSISIMGEEVEVVEEYRNIGIHLTTDWTQNARGNVKTTLATYH